jgi:hypothetical protein
MVTTKNKTQVKFSMKMPDWFLSLDLEEKRGFIADIENKVRTKRDNFHKLSNEELKGLMVSWDKKHKTKTQPEIK